jgi:predicted phage-related endonuclease
METPTRQIGTGKPDTLREAATMKAPIKTYGPQWHSARPSYLGASEVAAICGLDPWRTVEDVAESKYNPNPDGAPDGSPNTPIWWGHRDEPAIVEAGTYILRPHAQPWEVRTGLSWIDGKHGLMASPDAVYLNENRTADRIVDGPTEGMEAKSVNKAASSWRNGPPIHVQIQGHSQIAVLGNHCERVHIAARINGAPIQIWTIERDEFLVAAIKQVAKTWWEDYREMGLVRWSAHVASLLADAGFNHCAPIFRNHETTTIRDDQVELLEAWREARLQVREWTETRSLLDLEIKQLLADADTLTAPDGTPLIRRSWVRRMSLDTKTLCAENPELEAKYSYPLTHQRLTEVKKRPD